MCVLLPHIVLLFFVSAFWLHDNSTKIIRFQRRLDISAGSLWGSSLFFVVNAACHCHCPCSFAEPPLPQGSIFVFLLISLPILSLTIDPADHEVQRESLIILFHHDLREMKVLPSERSRGRPSAPYDHAMRPNDRRIYLRTDPPQSQHKVSVRIPPAAPGTCSSHKHWWRSHREEDPQLCGKMYRLLITTCCL